MQKKKKMHTEEYCPTNSDFRSVENDLTVLKKNRCKKITT